MKLAGVVILYNPDESVIDNINSYIEDVDFLYILDNTEDYSDFSSIAFSRLKNHRYNYIPFRKNMGIAYALNYVIRISQTYDFLLTMDQDSKFSKGMLKKYKDKISQFCQNDVAMYALNYNSERSDEGTTRLPHEVEKAITSGSIVDLAKARVVGGFDENLFIDEVDHEFCFRAIKNGYRIIEFNDIHLMHHLGNPITKSILGHHFGSTNHSEIRKYYITRNKIYVMKKYPHIRKEYFTFLIKTFFAMIILEKKRKEKIKYILRGIRDALRNNMGKYIQ